MDGAAVLPACGEGFGDRIAACQMPVRWSDVRAEASEALIALVRLLMHLATDLAAFAAYWAVLYAVQSIEKQWALEGWAGSWLANVHQCGVFVCGLWTTLWMLIHAAVAISGRKLGGAR